MTKFRYSKSQCDEAIRLLGLAIEDLNSAFSAGKEFCGAADVRYAELEGKIDSLSTKYKDDGSGETYVDSATKTFYTNKLSSYKSYNTKIKNNCTLSTDGNGLYYKAQIEKWKKALEKLNEVITNWEEKWSVNNLEETIEKITAGEIETGWSMDGVDASKFSFETTDDGSVYLNYTVTVDDVEITARLSDLTNAFWTNTNMAMEGNILARYEAELNGEEFSEAYQLDLLSRTNSFVTDAVGNGLMGVASEEDLNNLVVYLNDTYKDELGENEITIVDADSVRNLVGAYNLGGISSLSDTNSDYSELVCVGSGLLAAYTFTQSDTSLLGTKEDEESSGTGGSGGSGGSGGTGGTGGTGGSGGTGETPEVTPEEETTEEVPEEEVHEEYEEQYEEIEEVIEEADENLEDIKEDFEETDTEEIQEENKEVTEEFIDDQAKDDYFDKVNENDGDNSLREEIAEKTESFENRFIENQNNPTDAGTQEIKDELKELGYDDAAIDKIMSGDPTVAKNAFKVGVQDQEMAKIANELAEKAGIEDFDTSYDDSQSYDSLHDGTVNVELTDHDKFIDTLRPESGSNAETPKVVTEYDEYQQAESDFTKAKESYEEVYTETNKSIDAAEDAKADLDKYLTELKEKSGEDPTKWSEDEIKELNKLTTTYNTRVEEANENNEKYLKQYKEYKEARDSFNKEKGEYYDELLDFYQKELGIDKSNNNNNPPPSTPVVKEPDNSNYTDESFIHMINNGNGINWDDANELLNK